MVKGKVVLYVLWRHRGE